MRLAQNAAAAADGFYYWFTPFIRRVVMETYLSSVELQLVRVGGLVGHIYPCAGGRHVGACVGLVQPHAAERRYIGGLVGGVSQANRRFVGGCAGFVQLEPDQVHPTCVDSRAHSGALTALVEESLEAA